MTSACRSLYTCTKYGFKVTPIEETQLKGAVIKIFAKCIEVEFGTTKDIYI